MKLTAYAKTEAALYGLNVPGDVPNHLASEDFEAGFLRALEIVDAEVKHADELAATLASELHSRWFTPSRLFYLACDLENILMRLRNSDNSKIVTSKRSK